MSDEAVLEDIEIVWVIGCGKANTPESPVLNHKSIRLGSGGRNLAEIGASCVFNIPYPVYASLTQSLRVTLRLKPPSTFIVYGFTAFSPQGCGGGRRPGGHRHSGFG